MRYRTCILVLVATGVVNPGASGQSCDPAPMPGPPLIQHDLADLRGGVVLGSDALVRHPDGPDVPLPSATTDVVELRRASVALPDRMAQSLVWCAASIIAYVIEPGTVRLLHTETGESRDIEVSFDRASFTQVSDGSVWYRFEKAGSAEQDRWIRQGIDGMSDTVRIPNELILLDAHGGLMLLADRDRNASGGRAAQIVRR